MGKSKRIPTDQASVPPAGSLANAFAGLEIIVDHLAHSPLDGVKIENPAPSASHKGEVRIRRSTAHRGGKTVVVIEEFAHTITESQISDLASALRKACGTGGTCKERVIEIQGEKIDQVRAYLTSEGFRVKGS